MRVLTLSDAEKNEIHAAGGMPARFWHGPRRSPPTNCQTCTVWCMREKNRERLESACGCSNSGKGMCLPSGAAQARSCPAVATEAWRTFLTLRLRGRSPPSKPLRKTSKTRSILPSYSTMIPADRRSQWLSGRFAAASGWTSLAFGLFHRVPNRHCRRAVQPSSSLDIALEQISLVHTSFRG
jgi:hypothetical protein